MALEKLEITTPTPVQAAVIPDAMKGSRRARPRPDRLRQDARLRPADPGPPRRRAQPPQAPARADHRPDPRAGHPGAPLHRAAGVRHAAQARHRVRRHAVRPPDQAAARRGRHRRRHAGPPAGPDGQGPLPHRRRRRSPSSTRPTTCATSGFYPAVDKLLKATPATGQRMLLSATLDGDVDRLVRAHLREPVLHELDANKGSVTTMAHHVLVVGGFRDKVEAAVALDRGQPALDRVHPHPRGRHRAGRGVRHARHRGRRPARQPVPARARAQPAQVLLRQGLRGRRHRRRRARHPRRLRRPGRALRRPGGRQGLPAPLRSYGARGRGRRRRLHHHAAPGRRRRAADEPGRCRVPAPRLAQHPPPDDRRGARDLRQPGPAGQQGRLDRGQPWPLGRLPRRQQHPAATGARSSSSSRSSGGYRGSAPSRGGRGGQAGNGRPKTVSRSERWSPADR